MNRIIILAVMMAVSLFSPFCCNAEGGKYEVERFHTDSGVPVDITLIKHGSLEIRYKGISIQIDPVAKLGDRITDYASEFPKADFILVTHENFDHLDKTGHQCTVCGDARILDCNGQRRLRPPGKRY